MREKFISYLTEIGLRYAIHYAKYEGVTLALCELWVTQELGFQNEKDKQLIKMHYYHAPSRQLTV